MEDEKNRTSVTNAETVEEALEISIWDLIEHLDELDKDSEEYKETSNTIIKMYNGWIEGARAGMEYADRESQRQHEIKMKEIERAIDEIKAKEQNKQKITEVAISAGIGLAGTLISLFAYNRMFNKGLKFEETGTFTSTTMRNLLGKFKPGKNG